MGTKALAEAIILQSMEDLWNEGQRVDSTEFFKGRGFDVYAGVAGLNVTERLRLLQMVEKVVKHETKRSKFKRFTTLTAA